MALSIKNAYWCVHIKWKLFYKTRPCTLSVIHPVNRHPFPSFACLFSPLFFIDFSFNFPLLYFLIFFTLLLIYSFSFPFCLSSFTFFSFSLYFPLLTLLFTSMNITLAIPILFDYFLLSFRHIFKKKKAFLQPPPSMPSYFSFYFASHIFLISNLTYLSSRSLDFFSFLIVLLSYLFFSFFLLVLFLFLLIFYPSSFSYSFLISVH
ncbi:unnamed protein product [Acanthosepion pharaonis]|uniref:Uncharacterized protein n=1 Tax=Acanthosepion pharaonis TaxID=158019 RepID=A0A812AYX3_ACAPH|nr:unnamed protein product [Sepia pharaonis]